MSLAIHTASRVILATPRAIFRAFVDPEVMVKWRAPSEMSARMSNFDPRPGGGYRMTLTYKSEGKGKTDTKRDVVSVRFLELLPDETIVEAVDFVSDDSVFQGTMALTTTLRAVAEMAPESASRPRMSRPGSVRPIIGRVWNPRLRISRFCSNGPTGRRWSACQAEGDMPSLYTERLSAAGAMQGRRCSYRSVR